MKNFSTRKTKRMERKYIAHVSFPDKRIITFGKDPNAVIKRSIKKGFKDFVIFFNPKPTDVLVGGIYYERCESGVLKPIS